MTAYNAVRFRVKPGKDREFVAVHKAESATAMTGLRKGALIKTGDHTYCFIGEWNSFEAIVQSRPRMIASLDKMRPLLEDLGSGLGLTDPVSGETVIEY